MKKFILVTFCAFFGFLQVANAKDKIKIVTTTSQIGDLILNIVGESADVQFLMGVGIDPHLYQPTRSDISKLNQADVVFYNGLNLEGKMETLLERLGETQKIFALSDFIFKDSEDLLISEKGFDPHIWMDVNHWIIACKDITAALSDLYPEHAALYKKNQHAYLARLIALHDYAKSVIQNIEPIQKVLVTAHDAFGYFGTAYGIEVIGIQGISTESEAGLNKIESTVSLIVERHIPAVFVESSVGDHNIKAIIEGARARGHTVIIGGTLYSDAMGAPNTAEGTYIGMMVHNIKTIAKGLGVSPYVDGKIPDFKDSRYNYDH